MTIKEIAKKAGTSRATVDRVIHNRGKVNKELEERILSIIEESGFSPNEIARSLSLSTKDKQRKIGALIGSINHNFFPYVIEGIKTGVEQYLNSGISLVLKQVKLFDKVTTIKYLKEFKKEGISLLITSIIVDDEIKKYIKDLRVKVIALNIDVDIDNKICFIGCDYVNSGRVAANVANLILRENSTVALVIGSINHAGQMGRYEGFKAAINSSTKILDLIETYDNNELTYQKIKKLLETTKIDLIYFMGAGSDGGLKAIEEAKVDNLKVITVDQSEKIIECLRNGIVTCSITQHPYTQGIKSIEYAYNYLIKNKPIPEVKIIENSVILKESIIPHIFKEED